MTADNKPSVSSSANAEVAPPEELRRLGKYLIEKKIGAGGMGAVFLARDTELKRVVALKVLPRDKAANPTLVRRFRAEAQAAAQLRHDNIVAVYDSGEADGYLYIAMEYVDGQDLFEMVSRRGVVPVRRSIEIIKQVALALQHAYEQNIVHRDIKPSNLLIRRDGVVKLTDLGLARSVDDTLETNITRAGTTVGTVDYMSPEQARHSKLADIRSDLYSLGCTWYQMLTGSPPYPEGSVTNKLQAHAIKPIPDPRDKNPKIPEGLTAVIRRMMAKKPEDRYQTPAELVDELNHATLTQAAISREIFSDLSDDALDAVVEFEDEESSDGYMENHSAPTPAEIHNDVDEPPRKKPISTRPQVKADTTDSPETPQRSKLKPLKNDRHEPEPDSTVTAARHSRTSHHEVESDDEIAEADAVVRRSKPRTVKPDSPENSSHANPKIPDTKSPRSKSESPEHPSQANPKVADGKSVKTKNAGQKQLPPKMLPTSEEGSEKRGLSKDTLKYIGVAAGVVAVVMGLRWLISSYGANTGLTANPFEVAPGTQNPQFITTVVPKALPNPGPEASPSAANNDSTNTGGAGSSASIAKSEGLSPPFDVERLPEWVTKDVEPAGLTQLTVGPATSSATHFNSLDEALRAVPESGAVIKLQGDGPFAMGRVELTNRKYIQITKGVSPSQPVIIFKPGEGQTSVGLKVSDGKLELRGVHFVIERRLLTGPLKVAEVVDGQLAVRQCSFTSTGTGTDSAVALAMSSTQDSVLVPRMEPTVLIDQVFVRGDGLSAVSVQRANLDAVIRNTLIASGSASAIEVEGHLAAGVADVVTNKPRRILRMFHSTICTQSRAFDVAVDEAGKPPQTFLVLRDSLCCSHGAAAGSALLYAGRWPQVQSNAKGWLTRLTWMSTNSLYLGFEQLIDLGSTYKVADATSWQRVWSSKTDARQFQKFTFPDNPIDDLSIVLPQEFDSKALTYHEVKATDGGLPGCNVSQVTIPDAKSQSRVQAVSMRPALPAVAVKPFEPAEVRKVDLKKEDLGAILNRSDWQNTTLFEAFGGGLCYMSPARIEGRTVKIVFRQTDGANLKLQLLQPKSVESAKTDAPALITAVRSTIELSNAFLEGWPSSKGVSTDWLIQATDSTVVLNGCRLQGSESDAVKQAGLIRWITTVSDQSSSVEPPALVCRDCYLATSGCGIRMEAGRGNLILRNTVVAVRGDAFDVRPVRSGNALLSVVDVENVTISATGAAVRFEAAPGQDAVTTPVRLFVDRCAFAPPLNFKAGESASATLLRCVGPVMEQHQVSWWGVSNGIAKQIVYLIRRDDVPATPSDEKTGLTAWRQAWDKAGSMRLLTGDKGVYLLNELPIKWRDVKPGSFEMHKASMATTWAEGGRPIGANTHDIEAGKKPGAEAPGKAPVNPADPNKKPSLGF